MRDLDATEPWHREDSVDRARGAAGALLGLRSRWACSLLRITDTIRHHQAMIMLVEQPPKETHLPVTVRRTRRRTLETAMYRVVSFNAADPVVDREHIEHGLYATDAEAVNAARRLIDEQLLRVIATGLSPETASREWLEFGEIPVIIPMLANECRVEFDPFAYAVERAEAARIELQSEKRGNLRRVATTVASRMRG